VRRKQDKDRQDSPQKMQGTSKLGWRLRSTAAADSATNISNNGWRRPLAKDLPLAASAQKIITGELQALAASPASHDAYGC
jgi:hypothetical protein